MRTKWMAAAAIALTVSTVLAVAGQSGAEPRWSGTLLTQVAVTDLDRSVAFYTETLGFTLQRRNDSLQWARIDTGIPNVIIGLGVQPAAKGSGTLSLNFGVEDIDAARAALEAKGVVFNGETMTVPGVVRLAELTDPDGNRIRLAQDISQ